MKELAGALIVIALFAFFAFSEWNDRKAEARLRWGDKHDNGDA